MWAINKCLLGCHPRACRSRRGRRQIDERFARFVAAGVGQIAAHASDIGYIDMRYTNGFAIGWRQGGARVATGQAEDDNLDGTF